MSTISEQIELLIKRIGFAAICIAPEAGSPGFAYTVGLAETYGSPELLIVGVNAEVAQAIFHGAVAKIKNGERFMNDDILTEVLKTHCVIKAVSWERGAMYALNASARFELTGLPPAYQQIVYPDEFGLFPWEAGYSERIRRIQTQVWGSVH